MTSPPTRKNQTFFLPSRRKTYRKTLLPRREIFLRVNSTRTKALLGRRQRRLLLPTRRRHRPRPRPSRTSKIFSTLHLRGRSTAESKLRRTTRCGGDQQVLLLLEKMRENGWRTWRRNRAGESLQENSSLHQKLRGGSPAPQRGGTTLTPLSTDFLVLLPRPRRQRTRLFRRGRRTIGRRPPSCGGLFSGSVPFLRTSGKLYKKKLSALFATRTAALSLGWIGAKERNFCSIGVYGRISSTSSTSWFWSDSRQQARFCGPT